MAHLCPVRAYAEWLKVSQISTGFVFRRLSSGDRIQENDRPMVSFAAFAPLLQVMSCSLADRQLNTSWRCFATTSLTFRLTLLPMAPTHSGVVDASGFLLSSGGHFDSFVSGGVGVQTSVT